MLRTSLTLPSTTFLLIALAAMSTFISPTPLILILFLAIVYITGFRLASLIDPNIPVNRIGLAFISGFSFLGLAILIPYGFMESIPFGLKSYLLVVSVFVSVFVDVICFLKVGKDRVKLTYFMENIKHELSGKDRQMVFLIFIIGLGIRLAYSQLNSTSIMPDGALFFATGRTLAEHGSFSVNLINDIPIHSPFQFVYGLITRPLTWFTLGEFFSFGGTSFEISKFVTVFFGSLLIFPVCDLSRIWFKEKSWIAGMLIAINPVLLFFSMILFGPELISAVFALAGIVLLESFKETMKINYKTIALVALLFGASMLAWDDTVAILYLLAFSFSLMAIRGFSKIKQLVIISTLLALYLTLVIGFTWWNLFYPVYFLIFLVPLLFVFRKDKWIPTFALVCTSMTVLFNIFLNRFYMYPELVINPTINAVVRRQVSFYIMQNLFGGNVVNAIDIYQSNFVSASLLSILTLAFLSFVIYSRDILRRVSFAYFFLGVHFLAFTLFVGEESGLVPNYGSQRFFITPTAVLMVLAAGTIIILFREVKLLKINPRDGKKTKFAAIVIATILVSIAVFPMATDFYSNGYARNPDYLAQANYPKTLGVLDSISWIENHTSPGDLFLVASWGTTRVWSMEIEDREFASLNVVKNGQVSANDEITLLDVVILAQHLNASYIIFDSAINDYGYMKLAPYYNSITSKDLGKKVMVFDEPITFNDVINQKKISLLETMFVSNSSNKVVILEQINEPYSLLWFDVNFTQGWEIHLNGTLNVQGGTMTLATPPFCNDKVYAEYVFSNPIKFTNNTIMIFKAESSSGSRVGFYLRFDDDSETVQIFDYSGIYAVNLGSFAGKYPKFLFAYNILKPSERGKNSTLSASYDFFAIVNADG